MTQPPGEPPQLPHPFEPPSPYATPGGDYGPPGGDYGPPSGGPGQPAGPAGPSTAYPNTAYPSTSYPYAGPPQQPPKQPMGLSISSFVLGLLGCLPLAGVAAVVVGILALMKKQALKGLAIAGIILGLLWTAATVVFFAADMPARISEAVNSSLEPLDAGSDQIAAIGLEVGDCFNDPSVAISQGPTEVDADGITELTCDEPHDLEVYHVFDLPDGDFPGDEVVDEQAWEGCLAEFEPFVALPYEESALHVSYYYPMRATWEFADDRTVSCALLEPDVKTTGTLQGANR